VNLSGSDNWI